VHNYGRVIHEVPARSLRVIHRAFSAAARVLTNGAARLPQFDPWFNYRATEYLSANGWHAFINWMDYKVRPPGGPAALPLQCTV
jgi:asparagine N-glycosylation enzyme membrane subunit Stt3